MSYHDFLVDEHIENIMLFSPSLNFLTKQILFLKIVAYLLISCSPSLHLQNFILSKNLATYKQEWLEHKKIKEKNLKDEKCETKFKKEKEKIGIKETKQIRNGDQIVQDNTITTKTTYQKSKTS